MDRQPHNNLWAEKLLQVSMPDSGESWAGMEAILDRELPQRSGSEWRRWLLLILLVLLLIGVCNCPGRGRLFHSSGHGSRTGASPATPARTLSGGKPSSPALSNAATPGKPENPGAPAPGTNPGAPAPDPNPGTPGETPSTPTAAPATPAGANPANPATRPAPEPNTRGTRYARSSPLPPARVTAGKGNRLAHGSTTLPGRPAHTGSLTPTNRRTHTGSSTPTNRPTPAATPTGRPAPPAPRGASRTPTAFGDITHTVPAGSPVAKTSARRRPSAKGPGRLKKGTTGTGGTTTIGGDETSGNNNSGKDVIPGKNLTRAGNTTAKRNTIAGRDTTAKRNMIAGRDTAAKKNVTAASDTAAKKSTPALAKSVPRKDTLHKKPPPPPQDDDQKEKDHGWVFGIGLNQFFPIGGQRGSTYNADGLTGTLSDYLPVPMIRYYLNHKAYLQVEAQLNTPQATKKNLVFNSVLHDSTVIPGTNVQTSATLQQLYYFNIPLSFHYAVTDELNIGAGLQFSHLSNAIGNFDSTLTNLRTNEVTNPKDTRSFKDDTLYRRIRTNEFRFLIDASYTWKHIVVGVRYNQALSKFIDVPLPTGGSTQSRNSSLQIYVRYILWDTRRKRGLAPK